MLSNCPGALKFKEPRPEIIKCPSCGGEVEIWTDEIKTTCRNCKETVLREGGPSCLDWCKYARECVGDQIYNKYAANKLVTIRQKLIEQLEEYFGNDEKRIAHAKNVMHFAEELLKTEGGDSHIVVPASILHDVGIKEAERKYGSSAGNYQEKEGPAIARKFLLELGFQMEDIDEICEIIAHHHTPGKVNTQNFKLLYDADWLVNLKDEVGTEDKTKLKRLIDKVFLTKAGKELAEKTHLGQH